MWVIYGILAAMSMGVGQYIYAVNFSKYGIIGTGFIGPVPLLLLIIFKLSFAIRNKINLGVFINPEKSNIVDREGNFIKKNLVPLLGNWYANTAHVFLFTYAFKYAKLGGMNQGIIPIVTTTATLYNSILFYKAFGEKVSKVRIFGMCFTVCCVICLALDIKTVNHRYFVDPEDGEKYLCEELTRDIESIELY